MIKEIIKKILKSLQISTMYQSLQYIDGYKIIKKQVQKAHQFQILKTIEDTTITELLSLLSNNRFEQAKYLPSIWKLVFDNIIDINYKTEQIAMNSTIRLNHE